MHISLSFIIDGKTHGRISA